MKLLHRNKVRACYAEYYSYLCRYFAVDEEYGDFFVFSDTGDLRGVSDVSNTIAYTLDGNISILPSSYKLASVTEVKYLSIPYRELPTRIKETILNMVKPTHNIHRLDTVNPKILFSLAMEPLYMDGTKYKLGIFNLITRRSRVDEVRKETVLTTHYVPSMKDLLWDMDNWTERNKKNVEMNFMDCIRKGHSFEGPGMIIALTGHLVAAIPVEEPCATHFESLDKWVKSGFGLRPIMTISADDLKNVPKEEWYKRFLEYLESVENDEMEP